MKETGPEAKPPLVRRSRLARSVEKFVPVPEPNLKSMPSVRARPRMESMVSSTELMKQAEHCGSASGADVEPDRAVERRLLVEQQVRQFIGEDARLVMRIEEIAVLYAPLRDGLHHAGDERFQAFLARGLCPSPTRKYLETTTLVAICDQKAGISTSSARKSLRRFPR